MLLESESFLSTSKLLLPVVLVAYLELTEHKVDGEVVHFYFTEKNIAPGGFEDCKLSSKGFFPSATAQDFPIRGKDVFLHITRRRWLNDTTSKVVTRNWDLVAQGTRMTNEFATFLKGISR